MFKINLGNDSIKWLNVDSRAHSLTCQGPASGIRGHKARLVKDRTRSSARFNFFKNRVVSDWNSLRADTVAARTVNSFKARLDKDPIWLRT